MLHPLVIGMRCNNLAKLNVWIATMSGSFSLQVFSGSTVYLGYALMGRVNGLIEGISIGAI